MTAADFYPHHHDKKGCKTSLSKNFRGETSNSLFLFKATNDQNHCQNGSNQGTNQKKSHLEATTGNVILDCDQQP